MLFERFKRYFFVPKKVPLQAMASVMATSLLLLMMVGEGNLATRAIFAAQTLLVGARLLERA